MTSKFQKRLFPTDKLGILNSVIISTRTGDIVEIRYKDLKLVVVNNQLCYLHESDNGDLIMPIARENTIQRLFENK